MDDAIFKRVSIREFTDQSVTYDEVDRLMRAAMAAPSAGNQQPWEFVVTRSADVRKRLSECSPFAKPAERAPLVILACMRTEGLRFQPCAPLDMSAAIENILLEATSMGLGTVWMTLYPDDDRMAAAAKVAATPDGVQPFALIAVGHARDDVPPRSASHYEPERVRWM